VATGLAVLGRPADAQVPTLPPLTAAPSDPATTTTTLLPPLVPTEELVPPTPGSTTPPSSILPLPTTTPARRTTTFKPSPVPPSTPARSIAPVQVKTSRTTAARTDPAGQVQPAELGEDEPGFGAELQYSAEEAEFPTGDDTMELGIEESVRGQVGSLASVAAGLIAIVLLGVVRWLRTEVRRVPVLPS